LVVAVVVKETAVVAVVLLNQHGFLCLEADWIFRGFLA
jgi:hypothetical protein